MCGVISFTEIAMYLGEFKKLMREVPQLCPLKNFLSGPGLSKLKKNKTKKGLFFKSADSVFASSLTILITVYSYDSLEGASVFVPSTCSLY